MKPIVESDYASTCLVKENPDKARFLFLKHNAYSSLSADRKKDEVVRFGDDVFCYAKEKFGSFPDSMQVLDNIRDFMFVEPCLNAESHGHHYDSRFGIILESTLRKDDRLIVMVSQFGEGYDFYSYKVGRVFGKPRGGLDRILECCDKVWWKKGGSEIYLQKNLNEKYL